MLNVITHLFTLIDRLLLILRRAACLVLALWMVGWAALIFAANPEVIIPMFIAVSLGAIGLIGSDVMKW